MYEKMDVDKTWFDALLTAVQKAPTMTYLHSKKVGQSNPFVPVY
jgi:hypothetical protein